MIAFDKMKLIDLSVVVDESLPSSWPTHMPFVSKVWNYYEPLDELQGRIRSDAPYQTRFWIIDEHCGTHFDAPPHFIPPVRADLPLSAKVGEETSDSVPLQDMMGRAVCVDATALNEVPVAEGESPWITADFLLDWERAHRKIEAGEIVLLRTGWDKWYTSGPDGDAYAKNPLILKKGRGWPAPDTGFVQLLIERNVKCLGIDAPSVGAAHDGAPVHQLGLKHQLRYIELLTGLHHLPTTDFYFMFLPLKVKGGTGSPGRAVAWVPNDK